MTEVLLTTAPDTSTPAELGGRAVRTVRQSLEVSLRERAALAEVDWSALSRVERGLINPSPEWLSAVTDALGRRLAGVA